jgi:NAD(P)-dependent dehydrogenase (short-subunit alcohol dehydrogenase family)
MYAVRVKYVMLACSEHIAFTTFILAPLAGVVSYFTGYWQPSLLELAVLVPLWIVVQRFIAAGLRIPGKFTATPGSMKGKVALVTGANTGIGFWTAVGLAEAGATVVITCRDAAKCIAAVREIKAIAGASADVRSIEMELDELAKVRRAADAFKAMGLPLHVLVNNAGAVVAPVNGRFVRTPDGLESMMGCNFIAPVLLVDELLPLLKASRGRVVNVSSNTHATCGSASNIRRMLSADPDYETVIDPGLAMGFTTCTGCRSWAIFTTRRTSLTSIQRSRLWRCTPAASCQTFGGTMRPSSSPVTRSERWYASSCRSSSKRALRAR